MEEGRLFDVRRLVALDMGLHGPTFILIEFGLGVPVPMILGASLVSRGFLTLGVYLFTLGINYVPPLVYAVALRNDHSKVVNTKDPDVRRLNRKYSTQQFLIFIPFFIVMLDIIQRRRRSRASPAATVHEALNAKVVCVFIF
jgi:xanthine/uracil/vitamin C permease (AzgA family)